MIMSPGQNFACERDAQQPKKNAIKPFKSSRIIPQRIADPVFLENNRMEAVKQQITLAPLPSQRRAADASFDNGAVVAIVMPASRITDGAKPINNAKVEERRGGAAVAASPVSAGAGRSPKHKRATETMLITRTKRMIKMNRIAPTVGIIPIENKVGTTTSNRLMVSADPRRNFSFAPAGDAQQLAANPSKTP
jgi:hypothetical protein